MRFFILTAQETHIERLSFLLQRHKRMCKLASPPLLTPQVPARVIHTFKPDLSQAVHCYILLNTHCPHLLHHLLLFLKEHVICLNIRAPIHLALPSHTQQRLLLAASQLIVEVLYVCY